MSRLYCIIYKPTGQVCEVEGGVCYEVHRSLKSAERYIAEYERMFPNVSGHYEPAILPKHLKVDPLYFGRHRQYYRRLNRLFNGLLFNPQGESASFHVEFNAARHAYSGVVMRKGSVVELWEAKAIDTVRRIACGYYPSLCKHFGPARLYAGL